MNRAPDLLRGPEAWHEPLIPPGVAGHGPVRRCAAGGGAMCTKFRDQGTGN